MKKQNTTSQLPGAVITPSPEGRPGDNGLCPFITKETEKDYEDGIEDSYPVRIVKDDKGKYLVGVRRMCLPCQMKYTVQGKLTPVKDCSECMALQKLDSMP